MLRSSAMPDAGLITIPSPHSVRHTIDRLEAAAVAAGLHIFARVDHAAGAQQVEMALRPTELIIFGNTRGGTPLMQDRQLAGIDLPVKALAWQDEAGRVWLSYNDASWLARRHELTSASAKAVSAIEAGMASLAAAATKAGEP
jgi:uncharacterized protein (DUF302 family)